MAKKKSGNKQDFSGKKKAAVFLVTLGSELSAEIFRHLRQDEIETLTFEIAQLGSIESDDKESVLQEFQEMIMAQEFISTGGIEYARELLEKSLGKDKSVDIINKLTNSLKTRPLDLLRKTDPANLFNFIQQEHPQTIALILAHLDPQKASMLLSQLPEEKQSDVAKRIAKMDRTSPDVLRDVERVLEKKLSAMSSEDYALAGGVDSVVDILNIIERQYSRNIMESLEHEEPVLAEEIKQKMFVFDDIVGLENRDLVAVIRQVDTMVLAKALKGVDDQVADKIYTNMSRRAADSLKEEISYMGPTRRKDVEESQQAIVNIIRKLEDQGEITISRPGEDDFYE